MGRLWKFYFLHAFSKKKSQSRKIWIFLNEKKKRKAKKSLYLSWLIVHIYFLFVCCSVSYSWQDLFFFLLFSFFYKLIFTFWGQKLSKNRNQVLSKLLNPLHFIWVTLQVKVIVKELKWKSHFCIAFIWIIFLWTGLKFGA